MEKIDSYAFSNNALLELTYEGDKSDIELALNAFEGNPEMKEVKEEKKKIVTTMYFDLEINGDTYKIIDFSKNQPENIFIKVEYKDGKLEIPSTYLGKNITEISEAAFENKYIKELIIPNTIENIGADSFFRNNLTKITIPSSVKSIGNGAFTDNLLIEIEVEGESVDLGEDVFSSNGDDRNNRDIEFNFPKLEQGTYLLDKENKKWNK